MNSRSPSINIQQVPRILFCIQMICGIVLPGAIYADIGTNQTTEFNFLLNNQDSESVSEITGSHEKHFQVYVDINSGSFLSAFIEKFRKKSDHTFYLSHLLIDSIGARAPPIPHT